MGILPNGVLKVPGVQQFAWSPNDNTFSYWTPEKEPRPARVCIVAVPAMKDLSVKNLFNVNKVYLIILMELDGSCVRVGEIMCIQA